MQEVLEKKFWEKWSEKGKRAREQDEHLNKSVEVMMNNKIAWINDSNGRNNFGHDGMKLNSSNSMKSRLAKEQSRIIKQNMTNYNNMYNNISVTPQKTSTPNDDRSNGREENKSKRDMFHEYCEQCTIHGLKYVGNVHLPSIDRLFWIFSFILAIIGASYFIWHLYSKFTMSPIIISRSSDSVSINQFPFPAITICNMNNAKKSVAEEIKRSDDDLQKYLLDDICNWNKTDARFFYDEGNLSEQAADWDTVLPFIKKVAQNCSSMLNHCEWHGLPQNCTEIFNPVLTDQGLCCNFNSLKNIVYNAQDFDLDISYLDTSIDWNPEYKFKKNDSANAIPWRALGSGASYGLTLALDVNLDEYYCSSTASVGFQMLLHTPVEKPVIGDLAFTLSPGKETRVIITPHITDAESAIRGIDPKIRQCYFLGEKKLAYYKVYTQRNCLSECEANFTLSMCHCMLHYMPANSKIKICGKKDDLCAKQAKYFMKTKLYDEEDRNMSSAGRIIPKSCKCLPGCYEINYSTEISQSMLVGTFEIRDEFFKHNAEYFQNNIAIVHIFFVDTSYMKYTKNELYGFAELLSNTGGLLGLFMGFSLLSIVEIVYYFLLRIWWRICKGNNMTDHRNKFQVIQYLAKKRDTIYPFAQ